MKKKILSIFLIATVLLLFSTFCMATNENMGEQIQDSVNKTETTIQNAGENVRNVASDIGNGVQNAAQDFGRGVENMFDGNNDSQNTTDDNNNNNNAVAQDNNGYNAERTSIDGLTGTTTTNTMWIWLILGIVVAIIIGLTWYFVNQGNDTSHRNH